jgi:cellulose biosynthesis protein BcsQ
MALRVAVANHKGGVAKSTTAMMLSEGLAYFLGLRVLAIDFDPQASFTAMLLSSQGAQEAAAKGRTLSHLLRALAEGRAVQLGRYMTPPRRATSPNCRTRPTCGGST